METLPEKSRSASAGGFVLRLSVRRVLIAAFVVFFVVAFTAFLLGSKIDIQHLEIVL